MNGQPVDRSIFHPSPANHRIKGSAYRARRRTWRAFLALATTATGLLSGTAAWGAAAVLNADRVTLDAPSSGGGALTRVNFRRSYPTPPLVFVLTDNANSAPAALRVTNITTSGFDVGQFEPPAEDGDHPSLQFDYLAISPGNYNLGGGVRLEAGSFTTSAFQGRLLAGTSWQTLNFVNSFATPASLLLSLQGSANATLTAGTSPSPWLTLTARTVTGSSAQIALERSETSTGLISSAETVAYLAIASGSQRTFPIGDGNFVTVEALQSSNSIVGWDDACSGVTFSGSYPNPLVLSNKSSRDGGDGGWLRRCSLTASSVGLAVDEDRSNDVERNHTGETASLLIFSEPFDDTLPAGRGWEADSASIGALSGASLSFTPISFPNPFAAPPLIFSQPTENGTAPASLRVRSVTPTGFQAAAVEPPGSPGAHPSMTIDYVAVLPGTYRFADGTELEAGFRDTTTTQQAPAVGGPAGWEIISFQQAYSAPPALLAQIQTTANSDPGADPSLPFTPWLTVAVSNLSSTGVNLALERSEVAAGVVAAPERIGYLAITANRHGTLTDTGGASLEYDTRLAPALALGYDDGCFDLSYIAPFPSSPVAVAHSTTRNGNNGGWLRRCSLTAAAIGVQVDEDTSADAERAHIAEDAASIAFGRSFSWQPFPDIVLASTTSVIADPTGGVSPKSIPGALLEYQLLVTNTGAGTGDADSLVILDAVPGNTELFVGNLDGAGNPVVFTDGLPPDSSGLLFDAATDVSYSSDGGSTFNYIPVALEYDPAITHLRLNPTGAFSAASSTITPTFTFRYRVRVQ